MNKNKSKVLETKAKGKKHNAIVIIAIGLVVLAAATVAFVGATQLLKNETYYVLIDDVAASQPITTTMVEKRDTPKGTKPENALDYDTIQRGDLYARYALYRGDVVSWSNSGPASDLILGIPDDWAVTSFNVSSDDAVGGVLSRGDYIDILAVGENSSRYVFNNLLVLSANTSSEEVTQGDVTRIGETIQYTVGMPAEDVAVLHAAIAEFRNIKVIKSPKSIDYQGRDTSDLGGTFQFDEERGNTDLYEGSDATFAPVIRDDNGRPVNRKSCEAGLVSPKELCNDIAHDKGDLPNETEDAKGNSNNVKDNVKENDKSKDKISDDKSDKND